MIDVDPVYRLGAQEALDQFRTVVDSMAPGLLLIEPYVVKN